MIKKQETIGVLLALSAGLFFSFFPVLVNRGSQLMPPVTFAGLSVLTGAISLIIYALSTNKLKEIKNRKLYKPVLMITLFIIIIPNFFFFIGSMQTSGINSSLLLLFEIVFTVLITPFYGEKTSLKKIYGASGIFFGALFILYNGTFSLNWGDILIIIATASYPIGNLYTKRALNFASPAIILAMRSTIGGIFLIMLGHIINPSVNYQQIIINYWPYILANGILIFGFSKVIDYEAMKRLDISKAIALFMTFPIFSLIILIFLGEKISVYQWIGFFIMMIGIYFSIKRKSVDPQKTLYAK